MKACEILLNQRNYRKYCFCILENFIQPINRSVLMYLENVHKDGGRFTRKLQTLQLTLGIFILNFSKYLPGQGMVDKNGILYHINSLKIPAMLMQLLALKRSSKVLK